ncbi:MAG TPA: hypothetical protein ENI69_04965, partial [Rhodospirillales bacterium]|nr:hypothetical protein [Rhodospirillales bacterium]
MIGIIRIAALLLALGTWLGTSDVQAQGLNFASGDSDVPIEVFADDGIEWQQEQLTFLARGNARAVRGEVTVFADELQAFYRKLARGGTEIWRLDAVGHVRIETPGETAFGDRGVYDIDNAILVLSGGNVRLVTATDVITAKQQLEYWERKSMAVARGDATVVSDGKKLNADVLVAYFTKNKAGKTTVHRVEAFDNVRIDSGLEKATSKRAVYTVGTGIVILSEQVKLTRD